MGGMPPNVVISGPQGQQNINISQAHTHGPQSQSPQQGFVLLFLKIEHFICFRCPKCARNSAATK